MRHRARNHVLRRVLSVCTTALVVAVAALAVAFTVVPGVQGGKSLTVLTGSMSPRLEPGDLIAVVPTEAADLRVGDIITFQPKSGDPLVITHRIVRVQDEDGERVFTTRGDANSAADAPIIADQIKGRMIYSIPMLGYLTHALSAWAPLLVPCAAVALIVYGLIVAVRRGRSRPFRKASA